MVKKAITHLKLDQANPGKLHKLDELAAEHQRVVQAYVDWLIAHDSAPAGQVCRHSRSRIFPRRFLIAGSAAPGSKRVGSSSPGTAMSAKIRRILRNICIQANTNVVVIEPSHTPHFDFWLRISTLEAGHPVRIPITLYDRAKETLAQFPKLCTASP